jgi:NarL family two-component system response regulator YdfI
MVNTMKIKNEIRVILADDHAMVRRAIRRILEKGSNILVIGEASTGAGAIHLVQELQPDVLLLDMEMPDMKGHHVARELRISNSRVSILVLSACDDHHFIAETLQAGVDGYLHKSETPAKIREAIYQISEKHVSVAMASLIIFFLPKIMGF